MFDSLRVSQIHTFISRLLTSTVHVVSTEVMLNTNM